MSGDVRIHNELIGLSEKLQNVQVDDNRLVEVVSGLIEVIRHQQKQIELLKSKTKVEGFDDGD